MTNEIEIKYRFGIPTKKCVWELLNTFDDRMKAHPCHLYGPQSPYIVWQDNYTQSRIEQFIDWASEMGISFGKYRPYESPTVGQLNFSPR